MGQRKSQSISALVLLVIIDGCCGAACSVDLERDFNLVETDHDPIDRS
jgi:hypothetical protein